MTVLSSHRSVAGPGRRTGWTTARIISAVTGVLLALCSLGLLGAGSVALWANTTQRHGGGIGLGSWTYRSTGYAVVSSTADLYGAAGGLPAPRPLLGTVTISVTPAPGAGPVFAGIARAGPASRYLARVGNWTVAAMNADGSHPVAVRISVAAALPSLGWIAAGLLAGGVLVLAGGMALSTVPARRAASHRTPDHGR